MIKLDYEKVYKWALETQEPFTQYKFEKVFNLGRNTGNRFIETPAFEEVPVVSGKHYYQLSDEARMSFEDFKRLITMRSVARVRKHLGVIWTAFGKKDLSTSPFLPSKYRSVYAYIGRNKESLDSLTKNFKTLGESDLSQLTDEQAEKAFERMAAMYPVVTQMQYLMYAIMTDPRIEDKALVKYALEGNHK